jgi:hypothetical protein
MVTRLARLAAAAPRRLAGAGLLALIAFAVIGGPALGRLSAPRAFDDPGSISTLAREQIERATGHGAYPEIIALVKAPPASLAVARAASVIRADPAVAAVIVPAPSGGSPLVSASGRQTLLPAVLRAGVNQNAVAGRLTGDLRADPTVLLGGDAVAARQAGQQATREWPQQRGVRVPVIVPAWMWGPGDAGPTASGRLFLAVARGELTAVPRAGSHTADARDVAQAAIAAISGGTHARRYIIAAPRQPLPGITAQIAAATGARTPRQVPLALALAGSAVIELAARLRGHDPAVTRAGTGSCSKATDSTSLRSGPNVNSASPIAPSRKPSPTKPPGTAATACSRPAGAVPVLPRARARCALPLDRDPRLRGYG